MTGRPKNFSQAIDDLEHNDSQSNGFKSRLQSELRNLEETLEKIKPHIEDLTEKAGVEARKAKASVEDQVQKNPWAAIGIAGLIFFILGFLFAQKGRRD